MHDAESGTFLCIRHERATGCSHIGILRELRAAASPAYPPPIQQPRSMPVPEQGRNALKSELQLAMERYRT